MISVISSVKVHKHRTGSWKDAAADVPFFTLNYEFWMSCLNWMNLHFDAKPLFAFPNVTVVRIIMVISVNGSNQEQIRLTHLRKMETEGFFPPFLLNWLELHWFWWICCPLIRNMLFKISFKSSTVLLLNLQSKGGDAHLLPAGSGCAQYVLLDSLLKYL